MARGDVELCKMINLTDEVQEVGGFRGREQCDRQIYW